MPNISTESKYKKPTISISFRFESPAYGRNAQTQKLTKDATIWPLNHYLTDEMDEVQISELIPETLSMKLQL